MAPNAADSAQKLEQLRAELDKADVAAFIVPSSDPHLLEYAPLQFRRRAFISGFTGSAGTAIVTTEKAALWTDGRYFLQAEAELAEDWTLMRMGNADCPTIPTWLCTTLPSGSKIGVDPHLHSENDTASMKTELKEKDMELVGLVENPVDIVWGSDKPKDPMNPIFIHPVEIAGESAESKLDRIRGEMKKVDASVLLVAKLEEIAWTLNLRGGDEPYSPIFIAYLVITNNAAELFTETAKISDDVRAYLGNLGVTIRPYEEAMNAMKQYLIEDKNAKIWLDPALVNHAAFMAAREAIGAQSSKRLVTKSTPWTLFMAVKNDEELNGMREAHLRDGAAVIEFLAWFEKEIASGRVFTEVEVHNELTARRASQKGFRSCSFPTIAGSYTFSPTACQCPCPGANANGAIIHYSPSEENCGTVDKDTMLLIDSGGQYDCGTTDITRTFHLGTPTDYQRTCFTKVLQGHIAMATSVFPEQTPGIALDSFARRPLWSLGLQYLHGTGHGVGAYMCVHEGPIAVSFRSKSAMAQEPLKESMIVSNEPGYYESGQFGVRIESLCIVRKQETPYAFNGLTFFGFETITFAPIQKKLMKKEDMTTEEISWVDRYHQEVWDKVADRLTPSAKEWLKESTSPL